MICCAGYHHHHYAIQLSAALPFSASPLCALPPPARPHQRASRARPAAAARISSTPVMHSDAIHASFLFLLWPRVPRRPHSTSHTRTRQSYCIRWHPRLRHPAHEPRLPPLQQCHVCHCQTFQLSMQAGSASSSAQRAPNANEPVLVPPEPPFRNRHTNQPPRFCNLKPILDSYITVAQ
jgi:hypothetical protein